eukprot:2331146-Amphidinium_carterae.1
MPYHDHALLCPRRSNRKQRRFLHMTSRIVVSKTIRIERSKSLAKLEVIPKKEKVRVRANAVLAMQ